MITRMKLLMLLTIMAVSLGGCNSVFAQTSTPSARVTEAPRLVKVGAIVDRYIEHLDKLVDKSEALLDKIQTKIVRAKAAGKDVIETERLMTDARAKLASAQNRLNDLEKMKSEAKTRTDFIKIRDQFKLVKDDLKAVRKDVSEIIQILKGFNSNPASNK